MGGFTLLFILIVVVLIFLVILNVAFKYNNIHKSEKDKFINLVKNSEKEIDKWFNSNLNINLYKRKKVLLSIKELLLIQSYLKELSREKVITTNNKIFCFYIEDFKTLKKEMEKMFNIELLVDSFTKTYNS